MVYRSWYGRAGIAERKKSKDKLSNVPKEKCLRIRVEVTTASRYVELHKSCISCSLPNIHLDRSLAVSFAFALLSPCI